MADKIAPLINPILHVMRQGGGLERRKRKEIISAVIQDLGLEGSREVEERLRGGAPAFDNKVMMALRYLSMAGYVENPTYGFWALTEMGRGSHALSHSEVAQLLCEVRVSSRSASEQSSARETEEESVSDEIALKSVLIDRIRRLTPVGFEQFCGHLLRKSGLQDVEVTGKPGDGGIDGIGILRINPFVCFNVYFQCKSYTNEVGPDQVRDFRGAMEGRHVDKGLMLATSTFSTGAVQEASREGAKPIELVDGDRLVELCVSFEVGSKPKIVFEVDVNFFLQLGKPQG